MYAEEIQQLRYTLHDALNFTPGVKTIHDDVLGRRSGIGIRGAPSRRSRKTLLLKDGKPNNCTAAYSDSRWQSTRNQADWLADIYADDTIFTSPVRSLSQGGAELIRPQLWKPKKDHFCKVCFSDMVPSHTFEARMQICWVSDFSIGMKYHDIKFKEHIRLNKILSRLSKASAFENGRFVM